MKPKSFATLILNECMNDSFGASATMHKKFNNPDIRMRTRPAKASELLALQKRINAPRGHPFLMLTCSQLGNK